MCVVWLFDFSILHVIGVDYEVTGNFPCCKLIKSFHYLYFSWFFYRIIVFFYLLFLLRFPFMMIEKVLCPQNALLHECCALRINSRSYSTIQLIAIDCWNNVHWNIGHWTSELTWWWYYGWRKIDSRNRYSFAWVHRIISKTGFPFSFFLFSYWSKKKKTCRPIIFIDRRQQLTIGDSTKHK